MTWTEKTRDEVRALVTEKRWTSVKLADAVLDLLAERGHELGDGFDPDAQRRVVAALLRAVADNPELRTGHNGISPRKLRDFADKYESEG